jgi:hypothetical protein
MWERRIRRSAVHRVESGDTGRAGFALLSARVLPLVASNPASRARDLPKMAEKPFLHRR